MNDAEREAAGIAGQMIRNLKSGEPKERLDAAIWLLSTEADELACLTVPFWAGLLSDPNPDMAREAIAPLEAHSPKSEQALFALVRALLRGPQGLRLEIVSALGRIGKPARRAGRTLFQLIKDWSGTPQLEAAKALSIIFGISRLDINKISLYKDYEEFLADNNIMDDSKENPAWAELINTLLATVPKDAPYEEQARDLEGLNRVFRREMAKRLEPALNAYIQAIPQGSYDEKREVARWGNEELKQRFNLTIKGPADLPALLVAAQGNPPDEEIGRFFLETKSAEGKRSRTLLPTPLPPFELMEAAPRREGIREWRERSGQRPRGGTSSRA